MSNVKLEIAEGSNIIITTSSNFVPNVGEVIWVDDILYKINDRVIVVDSRTKKITVTLMV